MKRNGKLVQLNDYEQYVGAEQVQRVKEKAALLGDRRVVHINSTYYGGGVAELLGSLTLLMNSAGVSTEWRTMQGAPDFFTLTKKIHNALQGDEINLNELKKQIYEDIVYENAVRNHLDQDVVIVHDPQPLPLVEHYEKTSPWIWQCHLDLSSPNRDIWRYLRPFIEQYDAVVLSLEQYAQALETPQVFIQPAIDPFTTKNKQLSDEEIAERLRHHEIPLDLPLVTQISRFDRWKDPAGVIEAFKLARKEVDATLVLLGNVATDDPEGEEVYRSLLDQREERIMILAREDTALVNALQSRSAVVLQKSLREGFGLTVSEAMWKGTPVIGGNAGGIPRQIEDGVNGYIVSSVEEAAKRIVQLVGDPQLREQMGHRAHNTVKDRFLMIRMLEDYLDLLNSFETVYKFNPRDNLARTWGSDTSEPSVADV